MSDSRRYIDSDPRGEDVYIPRRVRVDNDDDDQKFIDEFGFARARHLHEQNMEQYARESGSVSQARTPSAQGQPRPTQTQRNPSQTQGQRTSSPQAQPVRPTRLTSVDGAFDSLDCDRVDVRKKASAPAPASAKPKKKKKKKYKKLKRWLKKTALLAVVLLLLYFVVANIALSGINVVKTENTYSDTPAQAVAHIRARDPLGTTNLLILGVDGDGSAGSRSDSIMIASINHLRGTLKLCSILRDCYVEVPGHDATRINHAYGYGGIELARQTVENNFRVDFDGVVAVDMNSLVHIVDALGGVTIELTEAEAQQINIQLGTSVGAGVQLLNGEQAVYYSRIRKIDSDFARTGRQRVLISAILDKLSGFGAAKVLFNASDIMPYITTTMSKSQLSWTALRSLSAVTGEIEQMTIPADGTYSFESVRGMSVLSIDLEQNVDLLHDFLF